MISGDGLGEAQSAANEHGLEAAEAFSMGVLDSLTAGICVLDEEGRLIASNAAWHRFASENGGDPSASGNGSNYLAVCDSACGSSSDGATEFARGVRSVIDGSLVRFEVEYACHSPETERWFLGVVTRFVGDGPPRVVVVHRDITELKLAERALRERSALLEEAQAVARLGYYNLDLSSGVWESSPILDSIFGIDESFPRDSSSRFTLIHPEDREMMIDYFSSLVLSDQRLLEKECRIVRASSGETREVYGTGRLHYDEAGTVIRMVGTIQDVSERNRGRRKRQEAQVRLQLAVRASNLGLWDWDLGTGEVYFSPEWKQQLGYDDDEIGPAFSEWESRVHPDDLQAVMSTIDACITEGSSASFANEFRMRHKNGSYRWILAEAAVMHDPQGRPVRILGSHIDLTEHKQSERAGVIIGRLHEFARSHTLDELLRETLDQTGALLESPAGFYHFVDANEESIVLRAWSTATVAGICSAADSGVHYRISSAGVWADCVRKRRAVVHNDYASLENRKGLPPGHAPVHRELVVPIFRGGRIVAILGIGNKPSDYTDHDVRLATHIANVAWEVAARKQSDQELMVSEERFRLSMELSPEPVFLYRDGRFVFINAAGLELFGARSIDDLLGTLVSDRVHPAYRAIALERAKSVTEHGSIAPLIAMQFLRLDGSIVDVEATATMIGTPADPTIEVVLRDITERKANDSEIKRHRQRLAHLAAELLRSGERERHRVAVELHDGIGQSLAASKLSAQQLVFDAEGHADAENAELLLEALDSAIKGIRSITLELSPPLLHAFGLGPALERLAESFLQRYGLNCDVNFDNASGELKNDAASMMHRCATELLNNVQRHSGTRYASLDVSIREGVVVLRVEDSGRGFDVGNLDLDDASYERFGLMSIREEIGLVGGTTKIDSAIGRGTCVEVRLPSHLSWSESWLVEPE